MTKHEKLLGKVKAGSKHVTLTELIKLMELTGFSYRRGSKNHYIFYFKSKTVGVAPPHPGRFVKPVYVKNCIKAIEEVIKNEQENK